MPARKPFLLRTDQGTLEALRRWADDEFRSLNGQIEYLLRTALREAGRLPARERTSGDGASGPASRNAPRKAGPEA